MSEISSRQVELDNIPDVEVVRITGRVRQPFVLSARELFAMDTEELHDILVICGDGTPEGRIGSCRGVPLDEIIRKADVLKEGHNDTKKMYLVVSGKDGYKVVFSWQEIFNTAVGGGVMILVEKEGRQLKPEDGMELISGEDYFMGARFVKDLDTIEVVLVE